MKNITGNENANKSTRAQVLDILKNNDHRYISGQEIADSLFLTRAGVWKAIKTLRDQGYDIDAISNRGYKLKINNDLLVQSHITSYLSEGIRDTEIIVLDEVESTNDLARAKALAGYDKNLIIISDYQTKGRGRRGRSFFSPKGSGLYISFLLHPDIEISKATLITCMTAVALCRAIKETTGLSPAIKWVNDIFMDGKKVSGILTEGYTSMETGKLEYVIVGTGINIYEPEGGFPEDIKDVAGTVLSCPSPDIRNRLCATFINRFFDYYNNPENSFQDEYRELSFLIGHYVKQLNADKSEIEGRVYVRGIDNECRLLITREDGTEDVLSSGEVSIAVDED